MGDWLCAYERLSWSYRSHNIVPGRRVGDSFTVQELRCGLMDSLRPEVIPAHRVSYVQERRAGLVYAIGFGLEDFKTKSKQLFYMSVVLMRSPAVVPAANMHGQTPSLLSPNSLTSPPYRHFQAQEGPRNPQKNQPVSDDQAYAQLTL